jgi:hypothetical protein
LDTSLNQTVRLIFYKGPKCSIPIKEHLFFDILRLLRPPNFTIGGFYSNDLTRLQTLFKRSGSMLTAQTRKFGFIGRLSCAEENVQLVREMKQLAPDLQSLDVAFFLVVTFHHCLSTTFLGGSRYKTWNRRNSAGLTRTVGEFESACGIGNSKFEYWIDGTFSIMFF